MNKVETIKFLESDEQVFVGKDILALLSSSMYINPLTIYREYIQNSVDAIDEAVSTGLLASSEAGVISIDLDQSDRRVSIRDNGAGVPNDEFRRKMLAFGASAKRGTEARGFRGVGRLAGLGYVQQLVFRSRAAGDPDVLEAVWDCRIAKQLLASADTSIDLEAIVQKSVKIKRVDTQHYPAHFFEVELRKPRRIANDRLLNESEIEFYLAQSCPCPFSPDFALGREINWLLTSIGRAGNSYEIFLNGAESPVFRPYRDTVIYSESKIAHLNALRTFEIKGIDGGIAAMGWLAHHDYQGAIPVSQGVRGLRARIGNMQIGSDRLFSDIFPEDRFCSWTIGEVHVLDPRIIPNGRRDGFEANTHLDNIVAHLRPLASEVARQCRVSSQRRNRVKIFELNEDKVTKKLEIIRQGAVSRTYAKGVKGEIGSLLAEMRSAAQFELFDDGEIAVLKNRYDQIEANVDAYSERISGSVFESIPKHKRTIYKEVFDLIYDCSTNHIAAKSLVDRMLSRLSRK